MAFVIADRVRESSTTTGTGNFTLGGAVTGYQTFDAVLDSGDTTYYTIADQGGANWEVGIGTFTSPSTLARTTILSSSNGGSIVTFTAGTKDVFISLPASKTNTNDQPNVISVNSTSNALRITQTGTGNALVVEDSANPDSTPFVVEANGRLIVGYTATVPSVGASGTPQIGVFSGSTTNNGFANYSYTASTGASAFNFAKSRSTTFGTPSIVLINDDLGYIRFTGDDGAQFLEAARIWAEVDSTPGLNSMPGRLQFSTTPSGATSPVVRMTIGSTGNIGIGTSGTEPFTIRNLRNFSGATTAYGISQGGEIQSGVTSSVFVNHTAPTTQAAAFTLSAVYHYSANSLTIGAGSAVTNQYGFFAGSGLTTATNNYGFYSDISSNTGRWNFYANGTANNYFAGQVQLGAGTVSAPALSTTGDTNTGIFFPAADQIAFAEGGVESMRIDSSGNVGIGTSSPGSKLEVNQGILTINTSDQSLTRLELKNTGTGGRTWDIVGGLPGVNNSQFSIYDVTAAATRMTIDSSGNVGINTASPGSALDVKGTLRLSGSTSGYVGLAPAAAAGSTTYTLPAADGTSGQMLSTNGSGTLSWASATATGTLKNVQVFTSSGTYTRTAGVTTAVVIAVGGGGGGQGVNSGPGAGGSGGAGGTTSFGAHVSAAGGSGASNANGTGGAGGTGGTGSTISIKGQAGSSSGAQSGAGGGQGGAAGVYDAAGSAGVRGGGGSGGSYNICGSIYSGGSGGQGETAIKYTTTVGATETVTIGAGGTAGTSNVSRAGGAGGAGYIIVYEYS